MIDYLTIWTARNNEDGMMQKRIQEGFAGQRMWVIPKTILSKWAAHPMLQSLIPTDMGWFPSAQYHYREREQGADEHILIFCVDGAGWCEIAGERHTVQANEALL